jgi:hypothetical protein
MPGGAGLIRILRSRTLVPVVLAFDAHVAPNAGIVFKKRIPHQLI